MNAYIRMIKGKKAKNKVKDNQLQFENFLPVNINKQLNVYSDLMIQFSGLNHHFYSVRNKKTI